MMFVSFRLSVGLFGATVPCVKHTQDQDSGQQRQGWLLRHETEHQGLPESVVLARQ